MQTWSGSGFLDSTPPARALDLPASLTVLGGMARRFDQFACGLAGHDQMLRFEPRRLSLRCSRCGHQTAGWTLPPTRPRRLLPAPARGVRPQPAESSPPPRPVAFRRH